MRSSLPFDFATSIKSDLDPRVAQRDGLSAEIALQARSIVLLVLGKG